MSERHRVRAQLRARTSERRYRRIATAEGHIGPNEALPRGQITATLLQALCEAIDHHFTLTQSTNLIETRFDHRLPVRCETARFEQTIEFRFGPSEITRVLTRGSEPHTIVATGRITFDELFEGGASIRREAAIIGHARGIYEAFEAARRIAEQVAARAKAVAASGKRSRRT